MLRTTIRKNKGVGEDYGDVDVSDVSPDDSGSDNDKLR